MEKTLIDIGNYMNEYYKQIGAALLVCLLTACVHSSKIESGAYRMNDGDKNVVVKMILDHPDLQQYLHPELDDRVPIRIRSTDVLDSKLTIQKFDKQVQFTVENRDKTIPIFEFRSFVNDMNSVKFEIAYDIEGVVVKGSMEKSDGQWKFTHFEVSEH